MNKNDTILFVASGMKAKKKDYIHNEVENLYLNYGLLGLATIVHQSGYKNVKMFQGDYKSIESILKEIGDAGIYIETLSYPVFISIPSFFAVEWAKEFIDSIKNINKRLKIVVGGRWVVDNNENWLKSKIPNIDYIIKGCPDDTFCKYLYPENWIYTDAVPVANNYFKQFDYNILNNYRQYQPSIEICRGCGRKCDFCLEKDYPISKIKSPVEVIEEAKRICNLYEDTNLNFYFQASIFNPTIEWAKAFKELYLSNSMSFNWRFETRVDTINLECIKILSTAGLKVIDLGLESASETQILRMNKAKNPKLYLSKAESLLRVAHEYGIWAKLNILLYLGENKHTINESQKWLDRNASYFKGVSVNPFFLYLNGENQKDFFDEIEQITGKKLDVTELYNKGYMNVQLSEDFSVEDTQKISKEISDRYMSLKDYYDLKEVCYTRRECV